MSELNNAKVSPSKFILISRNKPKKDLESLEAKITPIVNALFNQGIYDIHVRLYLCKYRRKSDPMTARYHFIYTSRAICLGIDKKTNRFTRVHKGSNELIKYAVEYWKYDHARAKDIQWNTLILHTDGYELSPPSTELNEDVEARAQADARDGIILKIGREITNLLYRFFIGRRDPDGMEKKKEEDKSSDNSDSIRI